MAVKRTLQECGLREISLAARTSTARLQQRFLPDCVRVLFIGEAPPASGRFFYRKDSGLYRAVRDAFAIVDTSIDDANFLGRFQSSGCYLIDLCPDPVDQLEGPARRVHCSANEPLLCRKIKKLQPRLLVTMLRSIRGNVERAAARADWQGRWLELPYPGRWVRHRESFIAELVPELRVLLTTGRHAG